MVDGSFRLLFVGDEDVLAIQEEDAKLFDLAVCHGGATIVEKGVPA